MYLGPAAGCGHPDSHQPADLRGRLGVLGPHGFFKNRGSAQGLPVPSSLQVMHLKQLGKLVSFSRPGDILYSICVETGKERIPVKLVFVRNRNKRSEYIVILSSDCSISDREIVRLYGNRWSIELFFRASKSLLNLGTEFQGLSYDMTVSSTAIVYTRYILLEWLRRKKNDDKTICELYYVCCDDIQDMELSTALKQLLTLLANGLKNRAITITSEVKSQLINWFVSQPTFIQALCPDLGWEV